MFNFEAEMLISEIKGILSKLETESSNVRFQLAFDNLKDLPDEMSKLRMIINRVDAKVKEYNYDHNENEIDYI